MEQDVFTLASEALFALGVPAHIKGHHFLREAVVLAVMQPAILGAVTKQLYPQIADSNATTPASVEKAIRHAVQLCWTRARANSTGTNILRVYFGEEAITLDQKPSNAVFIHAVSDSIRPHIRLQPERM